MNKVFATADEALFDIPDGATVMLGGFGLCGIPENSIAALVRRGVRGLHTISNNMGVDGFGMGLMLEAGLIASHTGSYVGENKLLEQQVIAGQAEGQPDSAGNAGGADSRGRRGDSGVLHAGGRGNDHRRRQGGRASSTASRICWRQRCRRTLRW